jgi:hypothetical protein
VFVYLKNNSEKMVKISAFEVKPRNVVKIFQHFGAEQCFPKVLIADPFWL